MSSQRLYTKQQQLTPYEHLRHLKRSLGALQATADPVQRAKAVSATLEAVLEIAARVLKHAAGLPLTSSKGAPSYLPCSWIS